MLPDRIQEDIEFELGEIDSLFQLYHKELLDMKRSPNLVELTALASVLHSGLYPLFDENNHRVNDI